MGAALLALLWVPAADGQAQRDTLDVLYVGNSYIYFNNLPALVEQISAALGGPVLRGHAHTYGGATLQRILDDTPIDSLLAHGTARGTAWAWVVLQEQSTLGTAYDPDTGTLGRADAFHAATRALAARVRAAGAEPLLYMTWARAAFPGQTAVLSRAYRAVGAELDVPVAAVGEAWAAVRQLRLDYPLYISDGAHPTAAGSYLAACVVYAAITGQRPVGAPAELTGAPWDYGGVLASSYPTVLVTLPEADAALLQRVAWEVVRGVAGEGREQGRR